jgi:N-acetyl-anhydromuramyl-L-alanine amidase AmpD
MAKADYNKGALLDSILLEKFDANQYYAQETPKKQVYLHFTVSGYGAKGDIDWWRKDPQRVAAHFIIDYDGIIHQLYSTRFWANHLGVKEEFFRKILGEAHMIVTPSGNTQNNQILNQQSIAIEIDTWGPLLQAQDGNFYPITWDPDARAYKPNTKIAPLDKSHILKLDTPYHGFTYYERFSEGQIKSVEMLLYYFNEKYGIPLTYNPDMFEVSKNALLGTPGVWSHTSVRPDKYDIMPQPEMIAMLKSLTA